MFQDLFFVRNNNPDRNQPTWSDTLKIIPPYYFERDDIQKGDKILLPSSVLQQVINFKNTSPMIFCIQNFYTNRQTYCGVLEFVAEQGTCVLPMWMIQNLKAIQHQQVNVTLNTQLKKCTYVKIQPHKTAFIELPKPKAFLEYYLRNFTCLHQGDTIRIPAIDSKSYYDIDILQIKPQSQFKAACIVDTSLSVDFAPPLDYEEPIYNQPKPANQKKKNIFDGKGIRLDQKKDSNLIRKGSEIEPKQQQYDPRKHRLPRGIRNQPTTNLFKGQGQKLGVSIGTKK